MRTNDQHPSWYQSIIYTAIAVLLLILALTIAVPQRIDHAGTLMLRSFFVLAAVLTVYMVTPRLSRPWRVTVRAVGVIMLANFLFSAVAGMQHMIVPFWNDAALIAFETQFTGEELSHILERITTPALTEWLMASYVIYIPLMPLTAWLVYHYRGEEQTYAYLLSLLLVNLLCDLGFILYPIASQLFFDPHQYTVPLTGGIFTDMAEWVRANEHFPGGSFPSPHNAAGTVMFVFLWRTHKRWAAVFTPFLLSIPLSTVYGRFHYVSDAVVGIAVAAGVLHLILQVHGAAQRNRVTRPFRLFPKPLFARTTIGGDS